MPPRVKAFIGDKPRDHSVDGALGLIEHTVLPGRGDVIFQALYLFPDFFYLEDFHHGITGQHDLRDRDPRSPAQLDEKAGARAVQ